MAFRFEDGTTGSVDALVSARDVRTLVEELWLAGAEAIAVNGERIVGSTAVIDIGGSMLVNSAYLALPYTITAIGPPDLYERLQQSVAFVQFVRERIEPVGIQLSVANLSGPTSRLRRDRRVAVREARRGPVTTPIPGWEPRRPGWEPRPTDPTRLSSRLTVAAVAALLGVLVIGQLRGQAGVPGLSALSATELTQLIANLTTGNDQLRDEIAELQRQESHLVATKQRGETTVDELTADLQRIRAWSGITPVTGQGSLTIQGPIGGDGVEDLLNELRNAGAEAVAVAGVRIVGGGGRRDARRALGREPGDRGRVRDPGDRQPPDPDRHADTDRGRDRPWDDVPARAAHGHADRIHDAPGIGSDRSADLCATPPLILSRRCPAGPSSSCTWATSFGFGEPIPADPASGRSIASAPTSACAAGAAGATCCSSAACSRPASASSSRAVTRP